MKNVNQDNWSLGQDSSLGPSEHEVGVLATQPRHLLQNGCAL